MSVEAMWSIQAASVQNPTKLEWGGIVVMETGRIFGGDSTITYIGDYVVSGANVKAHVKLRHWNKALDGTTVFGTLPVDGFNVIVEGTVNGEVITGQMYHATQPAQKLPVRMERIAELP